MIIAPLHRFIFRLNLPATGINTPIKIRLSDIHRILNQSNNPSDPQVINVDIQNPNDASHSVYSPILTHS